MGPLILFQLRLAPIYCSSSGVLHKLFNGKAAEIYGKIPSAWTTEKAIGIYYTDAMDRQWVNSTIIKKLNFHTVATHRFQIIYNNFNVVQLCLSCSQLHKNCKVSKASHSFTVRIKHEININKHEVLYKRICKYQYPFQIE